MSGVNIRLAAMLREREHVVERLRRSGNAAGARALKANSHKDLDQKILQAIESVLMPDDQAGSGPDERHRESDEHEVATDLDQPNRSGELKWCLTAAERGDPAAQYNLAMMYALGKGVDRNFVTAHMWLSIAIEQSMSDLAEQRDIIAGCLSTDELRSAETLARNWKTKSRRKYYDPDVFMRLVSGTPLPER